MVWEESKRNGMECWCVRVPPVRCARAAPDTVVPAVERASPTKIRAAQEEEQEKHAANCNQESEQNYEQRTSASRQGGDLVAEASESTAGRWQRGMPWAAVVRFTLTTPRTYQPNSARMP
eukprot:m.445515 g.445515  ORF g.445515 m.445515 type:complete len:120 (+) comp56853_c0_seq5:2183-2542(+)